jgi:aminoglycoside phosphotransferase (APT) family kinase protein
MPTRAQIQSLLNKEIKTFSPKGRGMCNNTYFVEASDGKKYLIKEEREDKETNEQNDLVTEGNVIKRLYDLEPTLPIPNVVFVSDNPKMYGYEYVEGEMMVDAWEKLTESEKVDVAKSIGAFHANIGKRLTVDQAREVGIIVDKSTGLDSSGEKKIQDFLDDNVPESYKETVQRAKKLFDETQEYAIFQCIHNDTHNENTILHDQSLAAVIDFGDCEYGDVHREFAYHVRRYPEYLEHFIAGHKASSGKELSLKRIISYAVIADAKEVAYYYHNPEREAENVLRLGMLTADKRMANYKSLMNQL